MTVEMDGTIMGPLPGLHRVMAELDRGEGRYFDKVESGKKRDAGLEFTQPSLVMVPLGGDEMDVAVEAHEVAVGVDAKTKVPEMIDGIVLVHHLVPTRY